MAKHDLNPLLRGVMGVTCLTWLKQKSFFNCPKAGIPKIVLKDVKSTQHEANLCSLSDIVDFSYK